MQADLRDQARKVYETTDGFVGAEETRNEGHGGKIDEDERWMIKDGRLKPEMGVSA
jgi:hypothetical protein